MWWTDVIFVFIPEMPDQCGRVAITDSNISDEKKNVLLPFLIRGQVR